MSYTYSQLISQITSMLAEGQTDADFQNIIPDAIDYAEQRIYRELDLLVTVARINGILAVNNRTFTFPFQVVTSQQINVITPASQSNPENGTRNPLTMVTKEYLDLVYPDSSSAALPQYYAMLTDVTVLLGPWPDQTYTTEIVVTGRPGALSVTNQTTYLSLFLPDLFFAAIMVFMAGYQKNFGSQTDDPKLAVSWESQYQSLLKSANTEEMRKRYAGGGWTSFSPTPLNPPRT